MMISLFCCLCLLSFLFAASSCKANNEHGIVSSTYNTPAPPPAFTNHNKASLKPGIAIIVGILTTIFSVTFLILLYVKHCKRNNYDYDNNARGPIAAYSARRNSGINRSVIDMLPVFRFGSLRGQKEGLECAVCLNKFDPSEVLRLLPKCKHAFHVECVDTWLDAHSTCPLCRHRVDPEDILLIQDHNQQLQQEERHNNSREERGDEITEEIRRISGRHSSAGERGSRTSTSTGGGGYLQVIVEKPAVNSSSRSKYRRSLDSSIRGGVVSLGCFERSRRDGLLLTAGRGEEVSHNNRKSTERRLEHRIVVGGGDGMIQWERWSNVHPSDLLYLKAEMIISDTHRLSSSSSRGVNVINERSVSEITGVSRGGGRGSSNEERKRQEEGFLKRWLAWISSHNTNNNNNNNNNQSSSPCSVPAVKVNTSRSTTGQQPSISSTP